VSARHPSPTPAEQRRELVRWIASEPVLIDWLRGHVAGQLEDVAAAIPDGDGLERAREVVRQRAAAHRRGETALW
jgi:hypothetical protein